MTTNGLQFKQQWRLESSLKTHTSPPAVWVVHESEGCLFDSPLLQSACQSVFGINSAAHGFSICVCY